MPRVVLSTEIGRIDLLAAGWTQQQLLDSYPTLKADDVRACLAYASEILHSEKVFPLEPASSFCA